MAETATPASVVRSAIAGVVLRCRARWPGTRRQREHARLALTELDIRRLDERIDTLLKVLAQVCDYSGQPDAARQFRSLCTESAPPPPMLRLVRDEH